MSFFISNSNLHHQYVRRLLVLTLTPAFCLFALGIYLQPLYGDLTRIGFFAEKDFGWNKPQLEFRQPLFELGRYDRHYDIVVLGDSFSQAWPKQQWQNHLVQSTGWSVSTLDFGTTRLQQVLDNKVFRETPPKFLIVEWVERYLPQRLSPKQSCTRAAPTSPISTFSKALPDTITASKSVELMSLAEYSERRINWSDIKLGWVLRFFWKNILKTKLEDTRSDVMKIDLTKLTLFSSKNKQDLLVYREDISKEKKWRQMNLEEMVCGIEMIREKVEANGYTRFIFMVAPDKLTAYADFVRDKKLQGISALPKLSEQLPGIMPRLDLALISAIRQGEPDVYLPDDTHWGSSGHQIVAKTLLKHLQILKSGSQATPPPIYNSR